MEDVGGGNGWCTSLTNEYMPAGWAPREIQAVGGPGRVDWLRLTRLPLRRASSEVSSLGVRVVRGDIWLRAVAVCMVTN